MGADGVGEYLCDFLFDAGCSESHDDDISKARHSHEGIEDLRSYTLTEGILEEQFRDVGAGTERWVVFVHHNQLPGVSLAMSATEYELTLLTYATLTNM